MLDNIVLSDEDIKIKIDDFENDIRTKSTVKLNGSKSFLIKSPKGILVPLEEVVIISKKQDF